MSKSNSRATQDRGPNIVKSEHQELLNISFTADTLAAIITKLLVKMDGEKNSLPRELETKLEDLAYDLDDLKNHMDI